MSGDILGFNDSVELLQQYQSAYENNDIELLKKLNEKFASTRVTLQVIIQERVHQKCLNFNGVNLLRVYYSVDIFGFQNENVANNPVLRTFQALSPLKRESPYTRSSLQQEESYHITGGLLRATSKHLAVVLDYHSQISTGIDEFDIVLLTESQDLSRLIKQNPVFRQFQQVKELELATQITLHDALIWRIPDRLLQQHSSCQDSIVEYQALCGHLTSQQLPDLIVLVKQILNQTESDASRPFKSLTLKVWSAVDGSEAVLYVKYSKDIDASISERQVLLLHKAHRRLSARLQIYLQCNLKTLKVIGKLESGQRFPKLQAPSVQLCQLQWGKSLVRCNVQLSGVIQKVECVILEQGGEQGSQGMIPIGISVECALDDGTGVAKMKLRDQKVIKVFDLSAEDLKSLEFEVKGKKQTLLTYKSELFRRLFRGRVDHFAVIGKPHCKVRALENQINFTNDPHTYDEQGGLLRPSELIKTSYSGPVFLNGQTRYFKSVRPKEEWSASQEIPATEDMLVRLNFICFSVSEIFKAPLLEFLI